MTRYTEQVVVRLDPELAAMLEAHRQAEQHARPGVHYSRESAIRNLLRRALRGVAVPRETARL